MNKKLMVIIGVSLIMLSAVMMIFWEAQGRELVMNKKVIAAERDISAGEEFSSDNIKIISVPKEVVVENVVFPDQISEYIGKKFKYDISRNSQISVDSFILQEKKITDSMSIFQIKKDWISNISSSVRKGDLIDIYACNDQSEIQYLGEFYVAFSKDGSGREVTETTGFSEPRIIERTNGISVPTDIEIAAVLDDYTLITKAVNEGKRLIIMQKGVSMYE